MMQTQDGSILLKPSPRICYTGKHFDQANNLFICEKEMKEFNATSLDQVHLWRHYVICQEFFRHTFSKLHRTFSAAGVSCGIPIGFGGKTKRRTLQVLIMKNSHPIPTFVTTPMGLILMNVI